jgi:hypothetical protein
MLALIRRLILRAPPGSTMVVEADERFDFAELPVAGGWQVRQYPPAQIAICHKPVATREHG